MDSEKTLIKNTVIYAIGNFGSKILAYVMVLIYSYYIAPEDMGYYDLILTTVEMMRPLVLFQINDGLYRFLIVRDKDGRAALVGTGMKFLFVTTIAAEALFAVFAWVFQIAYPVWIGLYFASTLFFVLMQDSVRGFGDNKLYATCGVVNSLVMLVFEVLGLMVLRLGVISLVISKVLANVVCCIMLAYRHKEFRQGMQEKQDGELLRNLLRYSAPLVPNTICWWIVNSSDRYIILYFLGASYNGLFSMAYKFPTIITTITSIFYLAWQESAIKEYNTPNRDAFFSNVFQKYYVLLFTLTMCAIPATHIVIELFVSPEYKSAWLYTGFLYLGSSLSALCSFLGLGYQISKETNRSMFTTIFAAILNIIINVGLISRIGLQAASVSTFAAYAFLFVIRIQHTKRYYSLSIHWGKVWMQLGMCLGLILITGVTRSLIISAFLCVPAIGYAIYENRSILRPIVMKLCRLAKKK